MAAQLGTRATRIRHLELIIRGEDGVGCVRVESIIRGEDGVGCVRVELIIRGEDEQLPRLDLA